MGGCWRPLFFLVIGWVELHQNRVRDKHLTVNLVNNREEKGRGNERLGHRHESVKLLEARVRFEVDSLALATRFHVLVCKELLDLGCFLIVS
jgi:hypothetical protein